MSQRLIIPDASVLVAALLPQAPQPGVPAIAIKRAADLVAAIRDHRVRAFAPAFVMHEVLGVAYRESMPRGEVGAVEPEAADAAVEEFLTLSVTYLPETQLVADAWRLVRARLGVSLHDAWYIACGIHLRRSVELWYTHHQADHVASAGQRAGLDVRTLDRERF